MKLHEKMPSLDGVTLWINNDNREKLERPTIVHFWSLSCNMCKKPLPSFLDLYDQYKDEIHFVSVHMPRCEEDRDIELVQKYIDEMGMKQPICFDNNHLLKERFHNNCVPTYYLFDREGSLRFFQKGATNMNMLENRIKKILA